MSNFQISDSQKVPYAIVEVDADGNPVAPAAGDSSVTTSSATASVTVVPDATPDPTKVPAPAGGGPAPTPIETGFLVAGSTLAVGVTITNQITKAGGTQLKPSTDLIDVIAGAASTGNILLGAPVSQ
jgi:hypothetical protein